MEQEKPLHARVAEALGWRAWQSKHGHWIVTHGEGADEPGETCEAGFHMRRDKFDPQTGERLPGRQWWDECGHVPRYDTDWSATGPLIEKYKLCVDISPEGANPTLAWVVIKPRTRWDYKCGYGPTPLIAACNLILALAEAGKLGRE